MHTICVTTDVHVHAPTCWTNRMAHACATPMLVYRLDTALAAVAVEVQCVAPRMAEAETQLARAFGAMRRAIDDQEAIARAKVGEISAQKRTKPSARQ